LFTTNEQIGADVTDLFNYLTGYSAKSRYRRLCVAPVNLRQRLIEMMDREIEHAKAGKEARLIFKMNALEDPAIITQLYKTSQAGVQIDLLVRGICCLRPGVPGISENIRVTSIVGRFLEHSRLYYFQNGGPDQGNDEIYSGSADCMPRNLSRRVEILFPIEDTRLKHRIKDEILATYLADTAHARIMHSDGCYTRAEHDEGNGLDAQAWFLNQAIAGRG
jgi:polyphosphate kinase